jgi:hypothetical protein
MRIVIVALVVGLLAVAGCQPTPVHPLLATVELPAEARGSLGRIEVVVAQPQSQITISSLPNPGLTFASGVTAGLNTGWLKERAELINKALPTFDFADELLRAAQQSIAGLSKPNLQVRPVVARSVADSLAAFNASTADAVMFLSVTYILTEQGALRFDSWLRLIPRTEALRRFRPRPDEASPLDVGNAIFRKHVDKERLFLGADVPEKVKQLFLAGGRDGAAWAAAGLNTLK